MTSITELAQDTRAQQAEAKRRQEAAAERAAKAEQARQEAEDAIAAAEAEHSEATRISGRKYTDALRALTSEVREAQAAAEAAVAQGGDVIGLWTTWRTVRARNRGVWSQLAGHYEQATGAAAPPGAWGMNTVETSAPGRALGFEKWLTQVTARLEVTAEADGRTRTVSALHQAAQ